MGAEPGGQEVDIGSPHNSELPKELFALILPCIFGIGPLKLLLETLNLSKLEKSKFGIFPLR